MLATTVANSNMEVDLAISEVAKSANMEVDLAKSANMEVDLEKSANMEVDWHTMVLPVATRPRHEYEAAQGKNEMKGGNRI